MTTPIADYPQQSAAGHDLDPNADGDLVLSGRVDKLQSIIIAVNSTSGQNVSASVEWQDEDGNTVQSESAADVALSGVTEDWARLVRKGAYVEVTFTSDAAAGTANLINAYVDGHR